MIGPDCQILVASRSGVLLEAGRSAAGDPGPAAAGSPVTLHDALPEPLWRAVLDALEQAALTGWHDASVEVGTDGDRRWYEVSVAGTGLPPGQADHFTIRLRDISARVREEQQLRTSQERYQLLADNGRDVVWTLAPDGTITYVSPAIERVRGYTPDEAMRQTRPWTRSIRPIRRR